MDWFFGIAIGLIGLVFGSFLNVCIYRIPRGNFFSANQSFCPHCKSTLKWYDLVPVISYIALNGRCRVCKEKIPVRYPVVEALNGVLWVLLYIVYGISHITLILSAFCSLLLIISFIDISIMEIPNRLILAVLVLAIIMFILSFFDLAFELWWEHLIGMVAISGLLLTIALLTKGGIGAGDVKLMFGAGLLLGIRRSVIAFFIGIIIAAIIGIALVAFYGKSRKAQMPLAPSLSIGIVAALLLGDKIISFIGI